MPNVTVPLNSPLMTKSRLRPRRRVLVNSIKHCSCRTSFF